MLTAHVDTSEIKKLVSEMKELDPDLRKYFVKELKSDLQPFANKIQNAMNRDANPPLSGFGGHSGRTAWPTSVKATAYVTPSSRKSLARIEVFGRGSNKAAVKIADLAGTKGTYMKTASGAALIQELNRRFKNPNQKAGRFVWQAFISRRGEMVTLIEKTINEFADLVERRIGG